MNTAVFGKENYIAPSWEEMGELCFELAKKILKKRTRVDRLIALSKGGLTWSKPVLDFVKIKNISTMHVRFYKGVYSTQQKPVIVQSLPVSVEKETVLIFDDIADTGKTIEFAKEYIKMCGAKKTFTATLFLKPWSKLIPDFFAYATDTWIILPHEIREMIELLSKKWEKQKLSRKAIRDRLVKIGLRKKEVDYFLDF